MVRCGHDVDVDRVDSDFDCDFDFDLNLAFSSVEEFSLCIHLHSCLYGTYTTFTVVFGSSFRRQIRSKWDVQLNS